MPRKHEYKPKRKGFKRRSASALPSDLQQIWGLHSVEAALLNPHREPVRLLATENAWKKLEQAGRGKIQPEIVRPQMIDRLVHADAVHQGALLEARPLEPLSLDELPTEGCILALDQVTDPHNVGAILRTAAAFGVKALILTQRYSPETTGTLAKAASGALEYVPLVVVKNLRSALDELRAKSFSVIGLDSDGDADLTQIAPAPPVVLVLGAEGRGLRHGVREGCDRIARLDMPGAIKSLNVSNATALALYIASGKKKQQP